VVCTEFQCRLLKGSLNISSILLLDPDNTDDAEIQNGVAVQVIGFDDQNDQ